MPVLDSPLPDIACRIVELESVERARLADLLEHVAAFDERCGARRWGHASTADWLAAECAMERRTAREYVRVARRLVRWPRVAEALALRQLSYSQVRAITRAEETEDETELLRAARGRTVREIEQHVRQLRSSRSADLDAANEGRARRHVTWFYDEAGSLHFFGRLPADQAGAFVEAVETAAEQAGGSPEDPCCPPGWSRPGVTAWRADALVDLVTGGGATTSLVLHADPASLACIASGKAKRKGDVCVLRDGPAIPSEVARRLTCDAMISLDGLNLGRTTRLITTPQRRALEMRDGRRCRYPGCTRTHGLDGHHIELWQFGGRTDLDNLVLLCPYHHRLFHEGGFQMRRRSDGTLNIRDPHGTEVFTLPAPGIRERARSGPLAAVA